jgi:hypothetical protein
MRPMSHGPVCTGFGRPSACSRIGEEHFTLSNDPFFIEKVRDIVGLYLSPPENAVVLCVDE